MSLESDVKMILKEREQEKKTHTPSQFIRLCEEQGTSKEQIEACLLEKQHMGAYSANQRKFISHCLSIIRKDLS